MGTFQNAVVPLYTFPSSGGTVPPWTTLFGLTGNNFTTFLGKGQNRAIIMSPDLTPSAVQSTDYATVIENCHTLSQSPSGTQALVYISLGFGDTTTGSANAQIDKAVSLYFAGGTSTLFLDGIFFDSVPGTQGAYTGTGAFLTYLNTILSHAAGTVFGSGATYWLNPGSWPDETVMNISGVTTRITVENDYVDWLSSDMGNVPSWVSKYNKYRIGSIVSATSISQMLQGVQLSLTNNMGVAYFTDGTGIGEYYQFPSYWTMEMNQVCSGPPDATAVSTVNAMPLNDELLLQSQLNTLSTTLYGGLAPDELTMLAQVQDDLEGGINHIQGALGSGGTGATSVSATLSSVVGFKNGLAITVGHSDAPVLITVTDDKNNTYTQACLGTIGNPFFYTSNIFYASNIKNSPSVITAHFQSAVSFPEILVDEFSGMGLIDHFAVQNQNNTGTGANAVTAGNISVTEFDLLYCSVVALGGDNMTIGTGFSPGFLGSVSGTFQTEWLNVIATGTQTGSFSASVGTSGFITAGVSFLPLS
jgi:hypothetical protein